MVITAAATFVPCCAIDNCGADKMAAPVHEKEGEQGGKCSPFFSCTACQGSVDIPQPLFVTASHNENREFYEMITVFTSSPYITSFWQPPRLSF